MPFEIKNNDPESLIESFLITGSKGIELVVAENNQDTVCASMPEFQKNNLLVYALHDYPVLKLATANLAPKMGFFEELYTRRITVKDIVFLMNVLKRAGHLRIEYQDEMLNMLIMGFIKMRLAELLDEMQQLLQSLNTIKSKGVFTINKLETKINNADFQLLSLTIAELNKAFNILTAVCQAPSLPMTDSDFQFLLNLNPNCRIQTVLLDKNIKLELIAFVKDFSIYFNRKDSLKMSTVLLKLNDQAVVSDKNVTEIKKNSAYFCVIL